MKLKLLLVMMLCGGCLPATQNEVIQLTTSVSKLMAGIDDLQGTTEQLVNNGIIEAEKVDKINANIDKVQERTELIVKEVETAGDPVEAAQRGWDATKLWNPYYGYGALALSIYKILQGRQEKTTLAGNLASIDAKYSAAKIGMDKFRNENPDKAAELFNDVGEARKAKSIV